MQYRLVSVFILMLALLVSTGVVADPVTLVIGGEKVFLHQSPVLVDGSVYAPLTALSAVGAKAATDKSKKQDGQKVEITPANRGKFACKARLVDGELMVPIQDIAQELGAVAEWNEPSKTLNIRAVIENIYFDGTLLWVTTSYPVTYKDSWWKAANKLILDIPGVHIPAKPSAVAIENTTSVPIRLGIQTDGETARIVLDMPNDVKYEVKSAVKTSKIAISVSGLKAAEPGLAPGSRDAASDQPDETPVQTPEPSAVTLPKPLPPPPVSITDIDYKKKDSRHLEVYVSASGPAECITSLTRDPDQLVVDIKKAVLAKEIDDIPVGHEILEGIRVSQLFGNAVRLTLDLARIAAPDVRQDKSSGKIIISLEMPKNAGGSLAGKIVVVDAGHGGEDSGAVGYGGWYEKNSNLAIALRIQKLLSDQGAVVLMTRKTDTRFGNNQKVDLESRAGLAKRHSADFFISVHGNSAPGAKCPSGIETYYHGREASSRALATCIHFEAVKAWGVPDLSVRSDFALYQTGLSVLRNTVGIPAALIEVGYVKHPDDVAKAKDPVYQQKAAEAIVRGLKAYIEGNPRPAAKPVIKKVEEIRPDPEKPKPAAEIKPKDEPPAKTEQIRSDDNAKEVKQTKATASGPHRPGER